MEIMLSLMVGIGLAAATGFRIFVPPLVLSLAARSGHFALAPSFDWIASDVALITFAAATVLEIGAYYIPWLDNLLDTLATPTAVVAGILLTASAAGEMSPFLQWTAAVLGGGGTATVFQGLTVGARGLSTVSTAGFGNPLISTAEAGTAIGLSLLAVLVPVAAFVAVLALLCFAVYRIMLRRPALKRRRPA